MSRTTNSIDIVHRFFETVWNDHDIDAVDEFVVEDFKITNGGVEISSRDAFKRWISEFRSKVHDFELKIVESFQNEDGSRVASRWIVTGRNNGVLGIEPDGAPIHFTGTAVWAVREDGKLLHNWVERSSWELFTRLSGQGA